MIPLEVRRRKAGAGCLVVTVILMLSGLVGAVFLLKEALSYREFLRDPRSPEAAAAIHDHPEEFVAVAETVRSAVRQAGRSFSSLGEVAFRCLLMILASAAISTVLAADRRLLYGVMAPLVFAALVSLAVSRLGGDWSERLVSRQASSIPHEALPLIEDLDRSFTAYALLVGLASAFVLFLIFVLAISIFQSGRYLRSMSFPWAKGKMTKGFGSLLVLLLATACEPGEPPALFLKTGAATREHAATFGGPEKVVAVLDHADVPYSELTVLQTDAGPVVGFTVDAAGAKRVWSLDRKVWRDLGGSLVVCGENDCLREMKEHAARSPTPAEVLQASEISLARWAADRWKSDPRYFRPQRRKVSTLRPGLLRARRFGSPC